MIKMREKKYAWIGILLMEIIVLTIIGTVGILTIKNSSKIDTSLDEWESKYIEYDDGWYINKYTANLPGGGCELLHGPFIKLVKGSYTIKIQYESEENQSFEAYAKSGNGAYIKAGRAMLSKNQTTTSYKITVTEDIDNFEIIVYYNGTGYFEIKDITIEASTAGTRRQLTACMLLFIFLNICLLFSNMIKQNKNLLLALTGIILLTSVPLFSEKFIVGHDSCFHFMRIEGILKELLHGNIPVKLSSLHMDNYGAPVSVYYGDLLLYIPALFRLAGFSITTSYKIYIFLINAGTTFLSYYCFKKIFKDKQIALMTCFAYTTSNYRMVDIYVRAAVGEYSAMTFLPLVAYAVYRIYTENRMEWKYYKRCALPLALGMTGIIGTHVLTTEMTVIALLFLCIVLWKKTLQKKTFCVYILAIVQTLLLNLYFIVPFLDYYQNVDVRISDAVVKNSAKIQEHGACISDYFSFFKSVFGWSSINANERMPLTPGIILITGFIFAIVLWINKKAEKEMKLLTVFAAIFLYIASNLFPWNYLANNKWGNMMAQIQFPWRYIEIADIYLTVLFGMVLRQMLMEEVKKTVNTVALIVGVFATLFFISNYNSESSYAVWARYYDTAELNTYSIGTEYIRVGTDPSLYTGKIAQKNMQTVNLISRNGSYMELYCESSNINGTIEIPVNNYKGYQVVDEYGTQYEIVDGTNNVISFNVPAGFSGEIFIDFEEPWYWRLAEILSLITVVFICARVLLFRYKTAEIKKEKLGVKE